MRTVPLLRRFVQGQQSVHSRGVSIFKKYRGPTLLTPNSVLPHSRRGMNFNDGPLVWIDCEMTGLNFRKDKLLEIAVSFFYSIMTEYRLLSR
jgi:hypothetical protein